MEFKRIYAKVRFHTPQMAFNLYSSCVLEQVLLLMELAIITKGKSIFVWEGKVSSCTNIDHMD